MTRLAILTAAALLALMSLAQWALAGDICSSISGSKATLRPTDVPGAAAEVAFDNTTGDVDDEDLACALSIDGMAADVSLRLGRGGDPDTLTVVPPDGFVAVPEVLTIDDGSTDVSVIFPAKRMLAF